MQTDAFCEAWLEHLGCKVADFAIRRDEPELLEGALSRAAHDCDLLVTLGGMSVTAGITFAQLLAVVAHWSSAARHQAGKVGDIDDCPILALPGNPIAAVVAFRRPSLALHNPIHNARRKRGWPLAVPPARRRWRWESLGRPAPCRVANGGNCGRAVFSVWIDKSQ
jgi:molybdopterin molybdotransferase